MIKYGSLAKRGAEGRSQVILHTYVKNDLAHAPFLWCSLSFFKATSPRFNKACSAVDVVVRVTATLWWFMASFGPNNEAIRVNYTCLVSTAISWSLSFHVGGDLFLPPSRLPTSILLPFKMGLCCAFSPHLSLLSICLLILLCLLFLNLCLSLPHPHSFFFFSLCPNFIVSWWSFV